jgi:hypothetical protein
MHPRLYLPSYIAGCCKNCCLLALQSQLQHIRAYRASAPNKVIFSLPLSLSSRLQLVWKDNRISRYVSSFLILASIRRGHGSTCHVTFHSWTLIIRYRNVCFCCLHPLCSSRLGRRNVAQARAFEEEDDDDDDDDVLVTFLRAWLKYSLESKYQGIPS